MVKAGITTTVPVEILYAAGITAVDLNNVFITSESPAKYVEKAELDGYPRSVCTWIKGIYGVMCEQRDINYLIGVTEGDCSNTHALMETLKLNGVEVVPFSYPYDRSYGSLKSEMEKLIERFGASWENVYKYKKIFDEIRKDIIKLDELTWRENKATGFENHLWLVSSSDFNLDYEKYHNELRAKIEEISKRPERKKEIRVAFLGVPPIFGDIYDYLESIGARVVYNEVQRQFSMPFLPDDIVEQYRMYSYPYDIFFRIEDIEKELEKRNIDAVIHYTQSFCYRQIEDIIVRKKLKKPIITIEGETPGKLDARTKMRLEAFIEMVK